MGKRPLGEEVGGAILLLTKPEQPCNAMQFMKQTYLLPNIPHM